VISWEQEPEHSLKKLKEVVSDLLACVGPEVATNMVIDVHVGTSYE